MSVTLPRDRSRPPMTDSFATKDVPVAIYNAVLEERYKYYNLLAHIVCTLDGEGPLEGVREAEFETIVFRIEQLKKRVRSSISVHSF